MRAVKRRAAWLLHRVLFVCCATLLPFSVAMNAENDYAEQRARLLVDIAGMAASSASYTGRSSFSPRVMQAIERVPRHAFVPESQRAHAYENRPLPIGEGQTISQPFIVALMTDMLEPRPDDVVLEVGTGSGYQAAVLAELVARVYTVEVLESVGKRGAQVLRELGYDNVHTRIGDGYEGWPEHAPFDGIIVTAAAPHIPQPLIDQLKPGGRLVIPVGPSGGVQTLVLIRKHMDGSVTRSETIPVQFVPLTRTAD
ncbi:MAG: protein-L-isoaspartate(D-aspartate) O-methyltransferase [Pseudomonadota bacterium]